MDGEFIHLLLMQISPANTAYTCMNETLYRWTFNFRNLVVRQQNSGAVEDFILLYSAVYLRIQKWKNYWNQSVFAKVVHQRITAYFFDPPCIILLRQKFGLYAISWLWLVCEMPGLLQAVYNSCHDILE